MPAPGVQLARGVTIRLPDPAVAPGFRDSIRGIASFLLREVTDDRGVVTPLEGLLAEYEYFRPHRLCDASTVIDEDTFAILAENPAFEAKHDPASSPGGDPDPTWRHALLAEGDRVFSRKLPGADLYAVQAAITALPNAEIPAYLAKQAPEFFEPFPNGSWWFVRTDNLLTHRLTLLRGLLAMELTPDLIEQNDPVARTMPRLDALEENSLSEGVIFTPLLDPILLCFPLSGIGFGFSWPPHSIVFLYGMPRSFAVDFPPSLKSLYEPNLQSEYGFYRGDSKFVTGLLPGQLESLFQWWIKRLNAIYSHIADPTRFADADGNHLPALQTGWLLTFERMLADALVIRTGIQRAEMVRQEAAFDLLDKAESLLGYTKSKSGKGFEALLRRGTTRTRVNEVWGEQLPMQLCARFTTYTDRLYDDLYEHVRANALAHRVTPTGVRVWNEKQRRLESLTNDGYVSSLIRQIRNSSHGLIEQLSDKHRFLLASHRGKLPPQLPDLAVLLALALTADPARLCDGTWLRSGPSA